MGIRKELCEKIKAMFENGKTVKEIADIFKLKEGVVQSIIKH